MNTAQIKEKAIDILKYSEKKEHKLRTEGFIDVANYHAGVVDSMKLLIDWIEDN